MSDKELLLERLERLAMVLDEIMPGCAELVRDAITILKEHEADRLDFIETVAKLVAENELLKTTEIIRCKDCRFRQSRVSRIIEGKEWNLCEIVKDYKPADWFCADGEKKGEFNENV